MIIGIANRIINLRRPKGPSVPPPPVVTFEMELEDNSGVMELETSTDLMLLETAP